MRRRRGRPALVLVLAGLALAGRAQEEDGPEFRVNSYTTEAQQRPAVAADANGSFIVVWDSIGQDGSSAGIHGQRFSAVGARQGSEFRVNSYTTGTQHAPAVASDANGNVVVAWSSSGQSGYNSSIFVRRFNAAGVPKGDELQVNAVTTRDNSNAAIAADDVGNFVVVWFRRFSTGPADVFGRRFDAAGTPQGNEFQVNTYTTGNQWAVDVASLADGGFVVVWESYGQDGSHNGVFARRYDDMGLPQGNEFQVNVHTTGAQQRPAVASDASGNFIVAWQGQGAGQVGAIARRYNALAQPQGDEFQINAPTTATLRDPDVASDADGNFVVVWASEDRDAYGDDCCYAVLGRRFDTAGTPQADAFQVNSFTTYSQGRPAVAANPDGDFVVAWDGYEYGSYSADIFGQRYGDLLFQDGFESGGLTRWSLVAADAGDLGVGASAALAGTSQGMQALINDTNPLYVQDDTPGAEDRYRVRFYFDPNGFDPGEGAGKRRVRLFIAFNDTSQRLATIVLRRLTGAYALMGRVRRDDGSRADTGFIPIADAPHFVEFDWQRSSMPGADDGRFELRVDDVLVSELTSLDNDTSPVDFARMGALAVKTSASGLIYFDQFESRRVRPIGAE